MVKIRYALGGSEVGKTIGVLGLIFKPETDRMESVQRLDLEKPAALMRRKIFIDLRKVCDQEKLKKKGFVSIGQGGRSK